MRSASTLVALVGGAAGRAAQLTAEGGANVSVEPVGEVPAPPEEALHHLGATWRRAAGHGAVYTLVDGDPLGPVVREWAARLEGRSHQLELAIGLVTDLPMPDYYLVASDLDPTEVHWYLGRLQEEWPHRVVPVEMSPTAILAVLGALPFGRSFPPAGELAAGAREYVPVPGVGRPSTRMAG